MTKIARNDEQGSVLFEVGEQSVGDRSGLIRIFDLSDHDGDHSVLSLLERMRDEWSMQLEGMLIFFILWSVIEAEMLLLAELVGDGSVNIDIA